MWFYVVFLSGHVVLIYYLYIYIYLFFNKKKIDKKGFF